MLAKANITTSFPPFRIYLCLVFPILRENTIFCFSPEIREYPKVKG